MAVRQSRREGVSNACTLCVCVHRVPVCCEGYVGSYMAIAVCYS